VNPKLWAGLIPNGLGHVKPNHYGEMAKAVMANRHQLPYAWRILNDGVCDGCALGTTGMHDFTMSGIHLCTVRLNLLPLNTMDALDPAMLSDVAALRRMRPDQLRDLGRLPFPMVRHEGGNEFHRVTWDSALGLIADRMRRTDPDRLAFYVTSRGITNEVYYVAQKVARYLGTNNIDNSSRVCHAPSTTGLKTSLGVAASTCSYSDWIGADLIVFIGADVPNNQPVTTKYLYYARQKGTKVAVINPFREPGMERYWVPSVLESAVFGTKMTDEFFQIHTGGDIAFINGVLKALVEMNALDQSFIDAQTVGFGELLGRLKYQDWPTLEASAGASTEDMERFARMYAGAKSVVFVWSMGITQHRFGVQNVQAIANLALARGNVGREHCGLMPIRGHSGVQGSAEMGAVPWSMPGLDPISDIGARRFENMWGFKVPTKLGLTAVEMIDAAHEGKLDVLYSMGGNFLDTLPEPGYVGEALRNVPLRVHQDIVLTSQMLEQPAETVVLLPARTRYEQVGGGTETSTERRVYFSPEIPGRRIGESRSEWEIIMELAERVLPDRKAQIHFSSAAEIREEIARAIPAYRGIEELKKKGDAFQWGGPLLCADGDFPTPDGKAHFTPLTPPELELPEGWFLCSSRRGRQFNSMVQGEWDPLVGANRDDVLMSKEDAQRVGVKDGGRVLLVSNAGELAARCKIVKIRPRNVQVYWPEGNVLLKRGAVDPQCGIPDYNTLVQIKPLR
jgi:molybdopterin-dependent oxidoreductase alpha subunit